MRMGHSNVPLAYTCTRPHTDTRRCSRPQPRAPSSNDNLNYALGAIRVLGLELIEVELKPHLNTVLSAIRQGEKGAAEQVVISGILPILALALRSRGSLSQLTAKLVAELAREPLVRKGFADARLVPALLSVLTSTDQELLVHSVRAISRMSYGSSKLQELLLRAGAVPRLVSVLLRFPAVPPLEDSCLQALCNLSGMALAEEAGLAWERSQSLRPEESVFHGVPPHLACGFASSIVLVRVSRWSADQCSVSVEVFQRCSASFWGLHGNGGRRRTGGFPLSGLNLNKMMPRFPGRNWTQSLRTRMFHTFL